MQRSSYCAILAMVLLSLSAENGLPHLDPPGQPPLIIVVNILEATIWVDQDDGADGNMELHMTYTVAHDGHGAVHSTCDIDNLNWDVSRVWVIGKNAYQHTECTPRQPVAATVIMLELDTDLTEQVATALTSAAAGAAIGLAAAGPVGAAAGGAVGLAISLIGVLNGNDDLGVDSGFVPANGILTLQTQGPDGNTEVKIQGITGELPIDPACGQPPPPEVPPTPPERSDSIYPPLKKAFRETPSVVPEQGNPANLTPGQMNDIRLTLSSTALGLAEIYAGAEIEDAKGLDGVELAIGYFQTAQLLAAVGDSSAIAYYDSAFVVAATARVDSIPAISPDSLPVQISLSTPFISTNPGRVPQIMAVVFGGGDSVTVDVSSAPSGVQTTAARVTPGAPVFEVEMALDSSLPAGPYTVSLTAATSNGQVSRDIQLVANSKPQATGVADTHVLPPVNLVKVYPVPSFPTLFVDFELSRDEYVTVEAFDVLGRHVTTLHAGRLLPGPYSFKLDTSEFPNGVYFVRVQAGTYVDVRKTVIVK